MIFVLALFGLFESALFPESELIEENYNPARLAREQVRFACAGTQKFGLTDLRACAGYIQYGHAGLAFHSFGNQYYREQRAGFGFGFPAGRAVSAGLEATLLNCRISPRPPLWGYALKAGCRLDLGRGGLDIWLNNINRPVFVSGDRLPLSAACRVEYAADRRLTIYAAAMGQEDDPPFVRFGLMMDPAPMVRIQAGIVTDPTLVEYGIRLETGRLRCLYAGALHPQLGLTHCFGLSCLPR